MAGNAQSYLDIISQHLQEHRAALMVGTGFSRNAVKESPDVPDIPLWNDLANIFKEKLGASELDGADPLMLAEHVEIAYGRPELDRLLLSSIRDLDYQPSLLHRKLLQLPWSDIFTTNYDTLLERASENLTEQTFSHIMRQNDLLGSSGTTRIIKLHGSFPSYRPFIITSEDYRTYPQKFAPFVNTVQQALLENTLCMIGFSGNDPNFNNWIGWIRDNLGAENAPYMYLLLHRSPSDTRREWLRRRNIIPVDLSEVFPEEAASAIYEKTFDYLWEQYCKFKETQQKWTMEAPVGRHSPRPLSVKEALPILRRNRETCPKLLTLPGKQIEHLRTTVISPALEVLTAYCALAEPDLDNELEYLYEYDWLRGKALLPLFGSDLECYQKILLRHGEDHSAQKIFIQLSVLRTLRECGGWAEYEELHQELLSMSAYLTQDQLHQLRWEECLCALSRYEFQKLKQQLENWPVSSDMTLWVLRKAGLWAEYGECEHAHHLLQQAILDVRRRLSHQAKPDLFLLSLESAMMYLQGFVSQAHQDSIITEADEGKDGKQKENAFIDAQHRARHKQYHASWEEQNAYFVPRLEAAWKPFHTYQTKPTFDFGRVRSNMSYQEDKERILAFSFLRFREETGIPFLLRNVYSDKKAACGAAERIALYMPQWAILTLVRADEPKAVESTITRGVLSSWTQEETDQCGQFYLDSVLRTEDELTEADWFYRNSFARLAADVLPEVLSELCSKCSVSMLDKLLDLVEQLYASPKRLCYQQTASLIRRLLTAYPVSACRELLPRLASFPLNAQKEVPMSRYFPEPLQFIPTLSDCGDWDVQAPIPFLQTLLENPPHNGNRESVLERLLYSFYHGLLTAPQKAMLRDLLWDNSEFKVPNGWTRTACLDFPAPPGIDLQRYLSGCITKTITDYSDSGGIRYNHDEIILRELINFALTNADAFSPEQVSAIVASFSQRIALLSSHLAGKDDFMGIKSHTTNQMYTISHALWLLTAGRENWTPTEGDCQAMTDILTVCEEAHINHYGLKSAWSPMLDRPFDKGKELARYLRSVEDQCSRSSYDVLATAIRYPNLRLLGDHEIQAGVTVMAQQIAWCIQKQLTAALHTASITAQYQPVLLNGDTLELLLTGLSQLLVQTVITSDDTADIASSKGETRKEAAALARKLRSCGLEGERPEILDGWLEVIGSSKEFAEIRNS